MKFKCCKYMIPYAYKDDADDYIKEYTHGRLKSFDVAQCDDCGRWHIYKEEEEDAKESQAKDLPCMQREVFTL